MNMDLVGLIGLPVLALIATILLPRLAFTAWVLAGVGSAFLYPATFQSWWGFPLAALIVPLIQLIMFGMGTTLNLGDFARIAKEPWSVIVGIALQFGVMPITGYLLVLAFGFDGELAAGVILIGTCSGGVASNLMSYIGKGNVALSVTMTSVSTLLAPVMTPLGMKVLAGAYIDIDTFKMVIGVFNIIIVPIIAGLLANAVLYSPKSWAAYRAVLLSVTGGCVGIAVLCVSIPSGVLGAFAGLRSSLLLGLALVGVFASVKAALLSRGGFDVKWVDRALPLVSVAGICAILTILTAQTHDELVQVGGALLLAAVLHNAIGLFVGYWAAHAAGTMAGAVGYRLGIFASSASRLTEQDCRTVAFEVGMQNGGMATGLAIEVLKSPVAALPPSVFGTWMNLSGSLLANYWSRSVQTETCREQIEGV